MRQKGFTPIIILLVITALGLLGYFAYTKGYININSSKPTPTVNLQLVSNPSPTSDPTVNWKTYTNKEFGFSIKYPEQWTEYKDSDEPENIVTLRSDENLGYSFEPLVYDVNIRLFNKFPTEGVDIQSLLSIKEKVNGYSVTIVENEFARVWHRLHYFFKYGQDRFLDISLYPYASYIADNKSLPPLMYKYKEIFDQMISTFKFTQ